MRPLSAADLVDAWEAGTRLPPVRRALALLGAGWPDVPPEHLALLSVGQRDALLLTLREATFGPRIECTTACPACGEPLEFAFATEEIRSPAAAGDGPRSLSAEGFHVEFRLPNSLDVEAGAEIAGAGQARQAVLRRCLVAARRRGKAVSVERLPANVLERVAAEMAAADPQAEVSLDLACPACGHDWRAIFDIGTFYWSELHAWVTTLLHEVHALASAYGWSERDVLALSPTRRRFYLEASAG